MSELQTERGRNAKPEIRVEILDAKFSSHLTLSQGKDSKQYRLFSIVLTFHLANLCPAETSVAKCRLAIHGPGGVLNPPLLRDAVEYQKHVRDIERPMNVRELEIDARLSQGPGITRFVIFLVYARVPEDDNFEVRSTFRFSITDSYGIEWTGEHNGSWPSYDPLQAAERTIIGEAS